MRAIVAGNGGLEMRDVPVPVPQAEQVLVRVRAAGLNRAELAMAAGAQHGSQGGAGSVIGLEWSGVVEAVGADVTGFAPGQPVMCTGSGSYAEFAVTDWWNCCGIPEGMDFPDAAALPIALRTMHNALAGLGGLEAGETVLIHGASSAVGIMGLLMAQHMGAGLVIGSSGNAERRGRLAPFAGLVVDSGGVDWPEAVLAATGGRGAGLTVDLVSGPSINQTMRATAILGRIIDNGRLGGAAGGFDFDLHAARRIAYIGSSFRSRSRNEIRAITRSMRDDLWPALEAGRLRVPVDSVFPLREAVQAHDRMRSRLRFGKVVVAIDP